MYSEYFLENHLGNTRVATAANGTVNTSSFYYPFGFTLKEINNQGVNKYLFGGKELQDANFDGFALNLYDFGARFYDPALARWTTPDPLAEKARRWSNYTYCMDNPLRFIDPDGMYVVGTGDQGRKYDTPEEDESSSVTIYGLPGNEQVTLSSSGSSSKGQSPTRNDKTIKQAFNNLVSQGKTKEAIELLISSYDLDRDVKGLYSLNILTTNDKALATTDGKIEKGAMQSINFRPKVFNDSFGSIVRTVSHELRHVYQKSVLEMFDVNEREFDAFSRMYYEEGMPVADHTFLENRYKLTMNYYWNMGYDKCLEYEDAYSKMLDFSTTIKIP